MLNLWLLVLSSTICHHVIGEPSPLQNITIDNVNQSMIVYSGSWLESPQNDFDYGGNHSYSTDPTATATFTFSGQ